MTIRIDDDVPLPQPDKPDTWQTGPKAALNIVYESNPHADNWVKKRFVEGTPGPITEVGVWPIRSTDPELDAALAKDAAYIEAMGGDSGPTLDDFEDPPECPCCGQAYFFTSCTGCGFIDMERKPPAPSEGWVSGPKRYPAETTYDKNGVPTTDCFLVGGPLNGQHGPIVGTAQVVELDIYDTQGNVASVELYELGASKELGVRHHAGSKQP